MGWGWWGGGGKCAVCGGSFPAPPACNLPLAIPFSICKGMACQVVECSACAWRGNRLRRACWSTHACECLLGRQLTGRRGDNGRRTGCTRAGSTAQAAAAEATSSCIAAEAEAAPWLTNYPPPPIPAASTPHPFNAVRPAGLLQPASPRSACEGGIAAHATPFDP